MLEYIIPATIIFSGLVLCIRNINRDSNRQTNNYPANNNPRINNYLYFYDSDPPPYSE